MSGSSVYTPAHAVNAECALRSRCHPSSDGKCPTHLQLLQLLQQTWASLAIVRPIKRQEIDCVLERRKQGHQREAISDEELLRNVLLFLPHQ